MAALGWLLNLGFAGGGTPLDVDPAHYHQLRGADQTQYTLTGADQTQYRLPGTDQKQYELRGPR